MVDIHCHILPGFDDGAADMREALAMLRMAQAGSVTDIVVTPHFPGHREPGEAMHKLWLRYRALEEAAKREGLEVRLHPGAEILCLPQMLDLAREGQLPTLGDTDYVLTEFFFDMPFRQMDQALDILADQDYRPVVAHPERYEAIQHDPRGVEHWFRKGYLIQLNKGSILGAFGYKVQKTAEWILSRGLAHLTASDAHSALRRTPDPLPLEQRLRELCHPAYVRLLMQDNPARLIRGEDMLPPDSI